jgi:hypothetical protein
MYVALSLSLEREQYNYWEATRSAHTCLQLYLDCDLPIEIHHSLQYKR